MKERVEFLKFMEGKQAERAGAFQQKALLQFCTHVGIEVKHVRYKEEFGFAWLHKEYPTLPVLMDSRPLKEPVSFMKLAKAMTKSEVWSTYFQVLNETTKSHVGLIVKTKNLGWHVMHNNWSLPPTPGFVRITRVSAATDEQGIIFESLPSFCTSLRRRWAP